MLKKKKRRKPLRVIIVLSLLQWGGLYGINSFLAPESAVSPAAAQTTNKEDEPKVTAPADADQFRNSGDNKLVAYTKGKELYLENKDGVMYHKNVGKVTYFQWLGKSNSLLYFVQSDSLTGYIIQASTLKPHQLESWKGTDRKVKQAYFNPYMEFLYFEIEREKVDEIYKYDAVNGFYKFPLPELRIDRIDFDEKTDTMVIYDSLGRSWEYKNGHLYDPKGNLTELKRIKAATQSEDTKKDDTKQESKQKTNSTDEMKNAPAKETPAKDTGGTSKTTGSSDTTTKEQTPTSPQKETSGGLQPPKVTETPKQGKTPTAPSSLPTTKEAVPPTMNP